MALFYVRDGEIFIPEAIGEELAKLAKAIVKTCRLTFKFQMKTTGLNNAIKSGNKEQMYSIMQKCMEKNKALYNSDMSLSGAKIEEVPDEFFEDKDEEFFKQQLGILIDFAYINCVVESKMMPLMSAASQKTLGKKLDELYFFTNQGEIRKDEEEENEENGEETQE